ncbi:MAG: lipocalin family protein [Acidobacteriota bacterium]
MKDLIKFISIGVTVCGMLAVVSAQTNVTAVAKVDLTRYAGKWYEIGRYPNRFQKKCVGNTTATYTLKPNGKVEVRNECIVKNGSTEVAVGEAKIVDKATNAKLKVRFAPGVLAFLPFVWGDYWIIDLDNDYTHVAIGEPGRQYFWILSRQPTLDDKTYQDILRRAEAMGFDPARVVKTPQGVEVLKGAVIIKH